MFPNYYYLHVRDPEWGPAFIKTIAYAPWPVWIYLNGHEWAKRKAEQAGIAYAALDNGFRSVADDVALLGSATRSQGERSTDSGIAGRRCSLRRSPPMIACAATVTRCRSASSRSPTPASSTSRPPSVTGLNA